MMDGFKFVVSGRNTALGIYDTQADARKALTSSTFGQWFLKTESYSEWVAQGVIVHDTGEILYWPHPETFTIVAVRPGGTRLF